MEKLNWNKGQLLVEILVTISVFIVGSMLTGLLALNSSYLSHYGVEELQANLLSLEGLEAARSIRDNDFDGLVDGPHGILLSNNNWIFSGTTDTQDLFTRQVTISTVDSYLKKIVSNVVGPKTNVTLVTYLGNVEQSMGQSGGFEVDLTEALIENGNKTLRDINLINNSGSPITIDKITVWWNGDSLIQEVLIEDKLWRHNGTGSPDGKQPSGTELNIEDFTLGPGESEDDIWFKFDGPTSATDFIVRFTFTDGSSSYVLVDPTNNP